MNHRILSLSIIAAILSSCGTRTLFSESSTLPLDGWHTDSTIVFTYTNPDTTTTADVLLFVRHTNSYPYQNIWLEVGYGEQTDTIEFYLADQRGKWLGNHHGRYIEMPVIYKQAARLVATSDSLLGTYMPVTIRQLMRDDTLRGITDIGITIQTNN